MARPTRDYVLTEFGQMHVRISRPVQQQNNPLVCLHMMPQSGRYFEDLMESVCRDRLVIAPDYHGYGESDAAPDDQLLTIADYARSIWQGLDQLGITKVDLLGHHTGSKVAVEMARQCAGRVNSIVLVSASISSVKTNNRNTTFSPIKLDREGVWLRNWWQELCEYYSDRFPTELLHQQYVDSLKAGSQFNRGFAAAIRYNSEFSTALSSLDHPITVINPNDDLTQITPRTMDYIENGTLITRPDWETGFFNTNTDDVIQTVSAAIDDMAS